jgi:lincosamide nucleotidyltransferase A/C/D/E
VRAREVLAVLDCLERAGVECRLDGGWGVDALAGRETRAHEDLDLVVARAEVPRAVEALAALGFAHDASAQPGPPARIVLRDDVARQVDLHPVVFDAEGNARQELGGGAWGLYPADGLRGEGVIAGRPVRCLTAELQLRHHLGYEPDETDRRDVRLLAALLRRDPPPPYA